MAKTIPPSNREHKDDENHSSDGSADYGAEGDLGGGPGELDERPSVGVGCGRAVGVSVACTCAVGSCCYCISYK
jgi:hypothetical protein